MAKIVLRVGPAGARRKIIARLKSQLTHAFIGTTPEITYGSPILPAQVADISSDTVARVRELNFTSSQIIFQTENNLAQTDDSSITLFFLLASRPVNKLVLVRPSSTNWLVTGIITFDTISPSVNQPYYVNEIKIEVLDQV